MSKPLQSIDDFTIKLGSGYSKQLDLDWPDLNIDTLSITGAAGQPTTSIDFDTSSMSIQGTYSNFPTTGVGSGKTLQWGINDTSAGYTTWQTTGTDTITLGDYNYNQGTLSVKGDAEFEGDIKIQGKSLIDMLNKLEERLGVLHPNPELEERWEELKNLSKRYKELEAEIIEKEKMWNILKK